LVTDVFPVGVPASCRALRIEPSAIFHDLLDSLMPEPSLQCPRVHTVTQFVDCKGVAEAVHLDLPYARLRAARELRSQRLTRLSPSTERGRESSTLQRSRCQCKIDSLWTSRCLHSATTTAKQPCTIKAPRGQICHKQIGLSRWIGDSARVTGNPSTIRVD